ncbi:HAD domain-containing protein [Nocardia sp. NPDC051030]|uniref:HAD domain-containing protein n=1 Tax=Nocardia sp. NPDC051030 TaxID=3155162 RepID=UPI00343B6AA6
MRERLRRPLVFLDVDGPLIPFGGAVGQRAGSPLRDGRDGSNPLAARLNPTMGPLLSTLQCELVWATTWTHDANRYISPILGLPDLTVIEWPDSQDDRIDAWFGLHWKTRTLVEWAEGRSFIWIDDEIGDGDEEWVSAHHGGRALLHRVDPREGLQLSDFDIFTAWLGTSAEAR